MTTYWLNSALKKLSGIATDGANPILGIEFAGRTESIYCPDPSEYRVTAEVVQKAHDLGATIIAYSDLWGAGTHESKGYAKELGITVMPYKALFGYLRRYGVG